MMLQLYCWQRARRHIAANPYAMEVEEEVDEVGASFGFEGMLGRRLLVKTCLQVDEACAG